MLNVPPESLVCPVPRRLEQPGLTPYPPARGLLSPHKNIVAPRGDDKYLQGLAGSARRVGLKAIFWRFHLALRTGVLGDLRRSPEGYIISGGGNGEYQLPSARPREESMPLLLFLSAFYAAVFVLASATHWLTRRPYTAAACEP